MIASLGGFLARKSDSEPRTTTPWIGLDMIRHFVTALAAQADINERGKLYIIEMDPQIRRKSRFYGFCLHRSAAGVNHAHGRTWS